MKTNKLVFVVFCFELETNCKSLPSALSLTGLNVSFTNRRHLSFCKIRRKRETLIPVLHNNNNIYCLSRFCIKEFHRIFLYVDGIGILLFYIHTTVCVCVCHRWLLPESMNKFIFTRAINDRDVDPCATNSFCPWPLHPTLIFLMSLCKDLKLCLVKRGLVKYKMFP